MSGGQQQGQMQQSYGQPKGNYFQGLQQQGGPMQGRNYPGGTPGFQFAEDDGGLYPPAQPPQGQQPPSQQPSNSPGQYGGPLQPGGPPYAGIGIQRPGNWYSVPYLQTYGGQAAPFSDLSAQILNAMHMQNGGMGRFASNAAARYGYQGGVQQLRPDANPWGQQIMPYQWQPQWNPPTANPPPSGPPPGGPPPGGPPPGGPPPGGPPPPRPPGGVGIGAPGSMYAGQPLSSPNLQPLSGMDRAAVDRLMGTAGDEGQQAAIYNALRAAGNIHAGDWAQSRFGGLEGERTFSQRWNEQNAATRPVWDSTSGKFYDPNQWYAKTMGWKVDSAGNPVA
jgi:hypothetical protein